MILILFYLDFVLNFFVICIQKITFFSKPLVMNIKPDETNITSMQMQQLADSANLPEVAPGVIDVFAEAIEKAHDVEDVESVKEELRGMEDLEKAAEDVSLFGVEAAVSGCVELDSSSGSDSGESSTSSSPDDETSEDAGPNSFSEQVPDGMSYYKQRKSLILHKMKDAHDTFACKTKLSQNFVKLGRTLNFKYPKCLRCFPNNDSRIRNVAQLTDALDRAVAKVRKTGSRAD